MSDSTLNAIRNKVRRLTGSPSISQLSTADLDQYINTFYEQDFPSHLKLWNLHETYTFYTTPNEDQYTLPINTNNLQIITFQGINPPVYISGYQSWFSESREEFFRVYPFLNFIQTALSGNGTEGPYSFTLTNIPVLKRQVTIFAIDSGGTTRILADDGLGGFVVAGTTTAVVGTINYVTGAIANLTFPAGQTIPTTQMIKAEYVPYVASRPVAMLFFDATMTLRPVPDQVYPVNIEVYKNPVQLISSTDNPELEQWWQLIALGAARKVLQDRLDNEALASIQPFFEEQMSLAAYRTALQQAPMSTATIYTDMLQYPVGNRPFGGFP